MITMLESCGDWHGWKITLIFGRDGKLIRARGRHLETGHVERWEAK